MDSAFVSFRSLLVRFENAIESIPLYPPTVVEDFAEYSRRYVERATLASWRAARIVQRGEVDKLIRNVLGAESPEKRLLFFQQAQNETLPFFAERVELVRRGLEQYIQNSHPDLGIHAPESWNSYWQALLVSAGKACDDTEQNNVT